MRKNKALSFTLAVVVSGLSIVALSLFVETSTQTLGEESRPYRALTQSVVGQLKVGKSKFDEFRNAGGVSLENDIIAPLDKLRAAVQKAYHGEVNEFGKFENADEDILLKLRSAELELDSWINAARKVGELKKAGVEDGITAEAQKMDTAYGKIITSMQQVGSSVDNAEVAYAQVLKYLFWVSLVFLVGFVAVMSVFVFRVQRKAERVAVESRKQLDKEEKRMQQLTGFIEAVSNGNFEVALESGEGEDHVTATLVRMKTKLKENADLESKRTWAATGQAQIGEILRGANNSTELFDNIIRFIVKYTRSNQGGLFILNDDDASQPFLDLAACYAFERKKFLTKKVNIGDGIIGQCFLEKERVHLTEIPEDYVNITSGLGGTNPKSVLVVPLKVNDGVYGVLELASFNEYSDSEVELIEKFAESIAATVSSVKVNERTRELLEQTQQQAEEMKSQEEEMRQNMEELSATQEQLQRQMMEAEETKQQLAQRDRVFGLTTILSESDKFGTITFANEKLTQVSKYSREELIGRGHNIFRHPDMPAELFKLMWDTIQSGKTFQGVVKNRAKDGSHYWVDATIVPIRNQEGEIFKYIGARYHITNDELAEMLYRQQLKRLGIKDLVIAS